MRLRWAQRVGAHGTKLIVISSQGYLPTIAALPLEAREDPTQPITFATPDASDVVVEGAAAGVKAGIAVAAVVMLAAVANLF